MHLPDSSISTNLESQENEIVLARSRTVAYYQMKGSEEFALTFFHFDNRNFPLVFLKAQ
jgi:hypothetical protein